jgi:hypothetical protein
MTPRIAAGFTIALRLERPAAGDQIYDQDDDRDDEQQVNQRATEMTDESEEPENQQHNKNSPEHMFSFELVYFASHAGSRVRLRFSEIFTLFPGQYLYGPLKKVLAAQIWKDYNATVGSTLINLCA